MKNFYGHSPSSTDSRMAGVSNKGKYVHEVLANHSVKLAQDKAVDWDINL